MKVWGGGGGGRRKRGELSGFMGEGVSGCVYEIRVGKWVSVCTIDEWKKG